MRVAVIAQQTSLGGGTRFLKPLLKAMVETFDDIHITVLANSEMDREVDPYREFSHPRIAVEHMGMPLYHGNQDRPGIVFALRKTLAWLRRRRPQQLNPARRKALEKRTEEFDVIYLAWPYFLEVLDIDRPLVATFHDFNYKHPFGSINPPAVVALEQEVPRWMDKCDVCVTSSEFIMDELKRFHSVDEAACRVIALSTFVTKFPTYDEIDATRLRYGLPESYLICPGHAAPPHKNLATLLKAYAEVRRNGGPPLALIGAGTELLADPSALSRRLRARIPESLYEALASSGLRHGIDFFGLGYVPDADADALISGARVCVSPSLYEAGSGPGVDAWSLGTPMCMSDIPAFKEHLPVLGVDAEFFNPLDSNSMSSAITALLSQEDRMAEMASKSLRAMRARTWTDVAREYRDAFNAAILGDSAIDRLAG